MQQILTARGFYDDKIDGNAGMLTRAALGDYQKKNGLKIDCWPTAAMLRDAGGRALIWIARRRESANVNSWHEVAISSVRL
jgi:hypothetical protein